MRAVWAQRQEALLSDCVVFPDVFDHMVDRLRDFMGPYREQGDAGGNFKTPVEWPVLFLCYSNPEKPRKRVKLQLVMCNDKGDEETVTDVITLNKNHQRIEHLGLTLAESKHLLSTLQRHLLHQQVTTLLDTCADCPDCGTPLHLKARSRRSFRTLFGTFQFDSPRLEHCDCTRHKTVSFRPLSALLTESVAPELLYMEAKWSSLVSYGMSLDALQDFLPDRKSTRLNSSH